MKNLSVIFLLLTLLLSGLAYWSWGKLNLGRGGSSMISLAIENPVDSLDPAKVFSDDALTLTAQVLEPLYQYHYLKRPYELQPLLAESLPVVEQKGQLIRVKLRKGIVYHHHPAFKGARELTAHDFVMQFKRLAMTELKSPGRSLFASIIEGFDQYDKAIQGQWQNLPQQVLSGVQAPDDYTLLIHLTRPEPNIIYYLALNFVVPVPWELIEYYQNNLDQTMVGTGPYVYQGFNGNYFELHKFRHYREEYYPSAGDRYANVQKLLDSSKEKIPFIDQVRFYVSPQEDQRWSMFMQREIDLLTVPKTLIHNLYDQRGELSEDLKRQHIQLKHFPILANRWLSFNMSDPVFGRNAFLRRAVAYAINYDEYIQVISQNTNLRANSILVPGISGYLPAKEFRFKYNPELAREYLQLSGLTPEQLPTVIYSTRGNQRINLLEAELVKKYLEAIGLKVEIQVLSFSDFLRKGRAGELMFFTDVWLFDYPDGENILQLLVSSNAPGINKSTYSNPEIDALYLKLKETSNQDLRDNIIQRMEAIILEDLPWIPLMYESSFVLQYPDIKNFRKSSIIRNYLKYLKIRK
jgi:oligopeptide transport system substrate-binding protein